MWNKTGLMFYMGLLLILACNGVRKLDTIPLDLNGQIFTVELARTREEQARGLMYRKKLGAKEGMLFIYTEYVKNGFWMKNTEIPLSIAFIDNNGQILDIKNMTPHSTRTVSPAFSYMYALEVNKGALTAAGIGEGDTIGFPAGFLK